MEVSQEVADSERLHLRAKRCKFYCFMEASELTSLVKNPRDRKVLSEMVRRQILSPAGLEWVKIATDPWHDNKVTLLRGIPDEYVGDSVVCSVVQEIRITKPSSLPPGNWDARVTTLPNLTPMPMVKSWAKGNILYQWTSPTGTSNPASMFDAHNVSVHCISSGSGDYSNFVTPDYFLDLPSDYTKGPFKLAAMGLECVNTTSDLYRQGSLVCSRMNQSASQSYSYTILNNTGTGGAITYLGNCSAYPFRTAPVNLAEANLLPGTQEWHASEGFYAAIPLLTMGSAAALTPSSGVVLLDADPQSGLVQEIRAGSPVVANTTSSDGNVSVTGPVAFCNVAAAHTFTALFSNLSEQTSLVLRVRYILERYPNDQEPSIVVLASPTASYDPFAFELYTQILQELPIACMVKENAETTWWQKVASVIGSIAGPLISAIPHPVAKVVGGAITAATPIVAGIPAPTVNQKPKSLPPPPKKKKKKVKR